MKTLSAAAFCTDALSAPLWDPGDQHHSGPPHTQQDEGHGAVYREEGCVLATVARALGGPALEIGAENGISSRYILRGLEAAARPGKLYSVDIRHRWEDDPAWPLRVRVERDSRFYRTPEPVSWAFIDGNHTYPFVMQDIEAATASGATRFVFHDTGPKNPWKDPRVVVQEVFGDIRGARIWDITTGCGLMYVELEP